MKKISKISLLLAVFMMAFTFVSCSHASSSSTGPEVVAVFRSYTDELTFYDNKTWKEVWISTGYSYCNGSYELISGDWTNGEGVFTVESTSAASIPKGAYTVTISNGTFYAFGDRFTKQK